MERGHPVRQWAQPARISEENRLGRYAALRAGGQDVRAPSALCYTENRQALSFPQLF